MNIEFNERNNRGYLTVTLGSTLEEGKWCQKKHFNVFSSPKSAFVNIFLKYYDSIINGKPSSEYISIGDGIQMKYILSSNAAIFSIIESTNEYHINLENVIQLDQLYEALKKLKIYWLCNSC